MKYKLRMGFMERLAEITGDFSNGKQSLALFRPQKPALAATGLFHTEELNQLEFWLRKGEIRSSSRS